MKKTIAILATLAVTLFSVNASAQVAQEEESVLFNHWSVGVGILEDVHVQVAGTVFPFMQVRLLYNTLHPYIGIANAILKNNPTVGAIDPFQRSFDMNAKLSETVTIDKMDVTARFKSRELNLMVDLFPSKTSGFHFTVGAVFDLTPKMLTVQATPLANGQAVLKPDAQGNGIVDIGGISQDPNGNLNIWASYGLSTVRPLLGLGFGRPVDLKHRVGVNFDMGVVFIGGLRMYSESYLESWPNPTTVEINEQWARTTKLPGENNSTIAETIGESTLKYVGIASNFPVLPYIRLTINVRLF